MNYNTYFWIEGISRFLTSKSLIDMSHGKIDEKLNKKKKKNGNMYEITNFDLIHFVFS